MAAFAIHCSTREAMRKMLMTNLNELQYFSSVAQMRSFTLAAERLKLPNSSVSRAISRLEQRLVFN